MNFLEALGKIAGRRKAEVFRDQRNGVIGKAKHVGGMLALSPDNILLQCDSFRFLKSACQIRSADADGRSDFSDGDVFSEVAFDKAFAVFNERMAASGAFCVADSFCHIIHCPVANQPNIFSSADTM